MGGESDPLIRSRTLVSRASVSAAHMSRPIFAAARVSRGICLKHQRISPPPQFGEQGRREQWLIAGPGEIDAVRLLERTMLDRRRADYRAEYRAVTKGAGWS